MHGSQPLCPKRTRKLLNIPMPNHPTNLLLLQLLQCRLHKHLQPKNNRKTPAALLYAHHTPARKPKRTPRQPAPMPPTRRTMRPQHPKQPSPRQPNSAHRNQLRLRRPSNMAILPSSPRPSATELQRKPILSRLRPPTPRHPPIHMARPLPTQSQTKTAKLKP